MDGKKQIQKAYESILGNDFERAIEWFEQAIRLEPSNAEYSYKLSITYARSGKLKPALTYAERACSLDPEQDSYRFHLQHLQALDFVRHAEKLADAGGSKRLKLAVRLLNEAVAKDPLCLEAHLLLSAVHAEQGDFQLSAAAIQEVLKLNPQHEAAAGHIERYKEQLKPYLGIR